MNFIKLFFISILFVFTMSADEEGQKAYQKGIDELYKKSQPEKALESFRKAYEREPEEWSRPFMIGFTLKAYLKKPEEALSYFEKSWVLNKEMDESPFKETINCLDALGQVDMAIQKNLAAQKELKSAGKTPSIWFLENLSWLYWTKGDTTKALQVAPAGSWVKNQLAPRTIEIDWNIKLTKLLAAWNIMDTNKLRLTLPVERPFQKMKMVKFDSPNDMLKVKRKKNRGNQFLEIEKSADMSWPEEVRLQIKLEQNLKNIITKPAKLKAAETNDPNYQWATENRDGLFSLDDPEFIAKVEEITMSGNTLGEKAELALSYLRKNYKYGERVEGRSVKEWLNKGTGDCGYFTYIAIGMLRALKIPVRGLYGLNSWSDPPPALPHSIIEIYDASTKQWFPHDPQSGQLYGIINPSYVPFTAGNPKQDSALLAEDKVWELDTTWFFWNGSGRDTISYTITLEGKSDKLAVKSGMPATKPEYIKTPQSGGPPPVK